MKLILFIGHHKVGSSALQTYLSRNALALLRRGILYPAVESQGLATLLSRALEGGDSPQGNLPVNFREAHNALAFGMLSSFHGRPVPTLHEGLPPADDMLRTILRQIEIFEPHTVILAAEVFANFAAISPPLITRLAETFEGSEVHLTATFRRVDDYLVSWHGQRLRFGQTPRSLGRNALTHYYGNIHFNYRMMLEGWITALPGAKLQLRSYDQVLASGGAVQDFLNKQGIAPVAGRLVEPRVNQSLHRGLIEIARRANHDLEAPAASKIFRTLMRIGGALDLPPTSKIEMFGPSNRAEMAARFIPIHDWMSQVSGQAPFFADVDEIARLRPYPEHDVSQSALSQIRNRFLAEFDAEGRTFLDSITIGMDVD